LHIIPTTRDPVDGLALSSRNAYLTPAERQLAPALYAALQGAAQEWANGATKQETIQHALEQLEAVKERGEGHGVQIRVDYIEMNDPETFEPLGDEQGQRPDGAPAILSGAVWFGRTRIIDNIILGNADDVITK
jgi:pantoate--beta-alanine ligase